MQLRCCLLGPSRTAEGLLANTAQGRLLAALGWHMPTSAGEHLADDGARRRVADQQLGVDLWVAGIGGQGLSQPLAQSGVEAERRLAAGGGRLAGGGEAGHLQRRAGDEAFSMLTTQFWGRRGGSSWGSSSWAARPRLPGARAAAC